MSETTRPFWRETDRAAALARYRILDTPREAEFDDLTEIASQVCETPIAIVNLVDTKRQFFKAEIGVGTRDVPLDVSFCGHAIYAEDMMVVPDATKDPRFSCNPLVTGEAGIRFYAGALIKTSEGLPIGTVCVLDRRPRDLDHHQMRTLRLLARQAMTQIELRRAHEESKAALVEAKALQARQKEIVREMSHRMKNTLAMVQAIVSQTFRQRAGFDETRSAIEERLAALGRAQDSLVRPDAAEVEIHDVVDSALSPHRTGRKRFRIDGPSVTLSAQQALGLSLGLHELATNATKYGSLSGDDGVVDIAWSRAAGRFVFEWRESGGPEVTEPTRTGFGSRLVERIVASYFDGQATLSFQPEGVVFRIEAEVPAEEAETKEDGETAAVLAK